MTTKAEFRAAVVEAKKLAHGDSNDKEIEALQDALDMACVLLGLGLEPLDEEAYDAAEKAGMF